MKTPKLIIAIFAGVTLVASVCGLSFSDVDVDINSNEGEEQWVYMYSEGYDAWDKTFDLLTAGFNPATMEILSATVTFSFADDWSDTIWSKVERESNRSSRSRGRNYYWQSSQEDEYASITVGDSLLWGNFEVEGIHGDYFTLSTQLGDSNLELLKDGILNYSVEANSGDFYLKHASIEAEVGHLKVPDTGATLGLLGLGIASILILRRQMLKGKDA